MPTMTEKIAAGLRIIAQDLRSPDATKRERAIANLERMAFACEHGRLPETPQRRRTDGAPHDR